MESILADGEALVGAILSDDDRDTFVHESGLELCHLTADIVLRGVAGGIAVGVCAVVAFSPVIPHLSPVGI